MAQAKDKDLPKDEMSSSEEITLMNKWWGLVLKASESLLRTKTSSTELGRGPGKWIDSKDGHPWNLFGMGKHGRDMR